MGCCKKRKVRTKLKSSLLMVGEGATERTFLHYLKSLFWCQNCAHNVKVDNANGGSPKDIVHRADLLLSQRSYSKCMIVLDTDIPWTEITLLKGIQKNNSTVKMSVVGSLPCLEGLMLEILEETHPRNSEECKRQFRKKYIHERRLRDQRKYAEVFPKEVIEDASTRIEGLDRIIRFLKNEL